MINQNSCQNWFQSPTAYWLYDSICYVPWITGKMENSVVSDQLDSSEVHHFLKSIYPNPAGLDRFLIFNYEKDITALT